MKQLVTFIIAATLALGAFAFGHHVGWNAGYDRAFCYDSDHWCELNEARLEAALGYDVIREGKKTASRFNSGRI